MLVRIEHDEEEHDADDVDDVENGDDWEVEMAALRHARSDSAWLPRGFAESYLPTSDSSY